MIIVELLQLRYFYESAKTESFAATAQKFMVPASSVSASVKRLETELGTELFHRTSNRIVLNEKGNSFAKALIHYCWIKQQKETASPQALPLSVVTANVA